MLNNWTKYLDPPTILEEERAINLNREIAINDQINVIEDATIIAWSDKTQNKELVGEVIDATNSLVANVNSGTIYNDSKHQSSIKTNDFEIEEFNNEIIYLGTLPICWGHYITDGICKLWFFNTELGKTLVNANIKIGITSAYQSIHKVPTAYNTILEAFSLKDRVEVIKSNTHYNKIYVPNNSLTCQNQGRFFNKFYQTAIKTIIEYPWGGAKHRKIYDKIYLSRTKLQNKNAEFGERQIEKAFKTAGFKIIYPERYSFMDQLWIYQHTKIFAGTEGSVCHNAMFCRENTEVIILRKAFYTNDHQYVINQARGLNVTYIDVHLSLFTHQNPNLGPFFLYINDNLVRFFNDRFNIKLHTKFKKNKFIKFTELCLKRQDIGERINNHPPVWYFEKAQQELKNNSSLIHKLFHTIAFSPLFKHYASYIQKLIVSNR